MSADLLFQRTEIDGNVDVIPHTEAGLEYLANVSTDALVGAEVEWLPMLASIVAAHAAEDGLAVEYWDWREVCHRGQDCLLYLGLDVRPELNGRV